MVNKERPEQHCADRPFKSGNALNGTRCRASIAHLPQHLVKPIRSQRCFPRSDRNSVTRHGASVTKYQADSQNYALCSGKRLVSCKRKPWIAILERVGGNTPNGGSIPFAGLLAEIWNRHGCCKSSPTKGAEREKEISTLLPMREKPQVCLK